jgi:hypothetical protein
MHDSTVVVFMLNEEKQKNYVSFLTNTYVVLLLLTLWCHVSTVLGLPCLAALLLDEDYDYD